MGLGAIAAAAKMRELDPLKMATWAVGEPVPFSFLVETFEVTPPPPPCMHANYTYIIPCQGLA